MISNQSYGDNGEEVELILELVEGEGRRGAVKGKHEGESRNERCLPSAMSVHGVTSRNLEWLTRLYTRITGSCLIRRRGSYASGQG